MIRAEFPWDPGAWYCDCNGIVHYLREHSPGDVFFEDQGSYIAVHILAQPDGEPGRAVLDSYVLHSHDEDPDIILQR